MTACAVGDTLVVERPGSLDQFALDVRQHRERQLLEVIMLGAPLEVDEFAVHRNAEFHREEGPVARRIEHPGLPGDAIADQAGTCRFGADPETSVLDVNCKAHELDNLYVADASFLPSVGAVGPALTVMANAIRVGEHLVHRLR